MTFSLELILVLATLITGLIWFVWILIRRRIVAEPGEGSAVPWYVDYSRSFFPILLVVLVLRSFVAEPFRIPSGSMMPTLLVGDFILVSKFAYGIRLPVTRTLLWETGRPQRGDVAVFKYPSNPAEDYIKRVLGVPGDVIEFRDRTLYVNGEPQRQERLGPYEGVGSGQMMTGSVRFMEYLGDTPHEILFWEQGRGLSGRVRVPDGHYFLVGDNRDNSNDSRIWGFVPEDLFVGRALFIWLNWDYNAGHWDFSRVGNRIQ